MPVAPGLKGTAHERFSLMLLERLGAIEENSDKLGKQLTNLDTRIGGLQTFIDSFHRLGKKTEDAVVWMEQLTENVADLTALTEMGTTEAMEREFLERELRFYRSCVRFFTFVFVMYMLRRMAVYLLS